jgi:hypothetical protein
MHGNECRQTYHILRQGRFLFAKPGREITAGKRTMSGQNAELSGQIRTLPVILTGTFGKRTN